MEYKKFCIAANSGGSVDAVVNYQSLTLFDVRADGSARSLLFAPLYLYLTVS
jgi:hypothetical protein